MISGKVPAKDLLSYTSLEEMKKQSLLSTHITSISEKELYLHLTNLQIENLVILVEDVEGIENLKYLKMRARNFVVRVNESKVTQRVVSALMECYPEKANAIRSAYMQQKRITEVLSGA